MRKPLIEVVAEVPPQAKPIGSDPHQLSLRADILKKHDYLEFEEDNRIDRRPTTG